MKKLYEETSVQAIADAIRAKAGTADTYKIAEMPDAIANLPSGGGTVDFSPFSQIVWGTITPATDLNSIIPQSTFGLQGSGQIQFAGIQAVSDEAPTGSDILISASLTYNKFGGTSQEKNVSYYRTTRTSGSGAWIENWGDLGLILFSKLGAGVTYQYVICVE